jgi:hypothetical protein
MNDKHIIRDYLKGDNVRSIATKFNLSSNRLYLILKINNIKRNPNIYTTRQITNRFKLSETEKAYIAGLFDGEGCLHLKDKSKNFWSICIANTNKEAMRWLLKKINNGGIYKKQKMLNNKLHIYYIWQSSKCNLIYKLLINIKPYCIIKKKIMTKFFKQCKKGGFYEKI